MNNYDKLKIENQLCFPLYAAGKEITRKYQPFLEPLDLTYTQYIVMMVLWENEELNVKELGKKLYLDSGTLTPLLKKLEAKGYCQRKRSKVDERVMNVSLTEEGKKLKDKATNVPDAIGQCVKLEPEEAAVLYKTLYKLLEGFHG